MEMFKKRVLPIIVGITLLLIWFYVILPRISNNNSGNDTKDTMSADKEETVLPSISSIFPDMFRALAEKVGSIEFNECAEFLSHYNYPYKKKLGSNYELGTITIDDDNDYSLTCYFCPDKTNGNTLTLLTYSNGNYEVSVKDEYHTSSIIYSTYDVEANPRQNKVSGIDDIILFVNETIPEKQSKYDESVKNNEKIKVSLKVSTSKTNNYYYITVKTNLPDDTIMALNLWKSGNIIATLKATVKNGIAKSDGLSSQVYSLKGNYELYVSTITPNLQPKSVQKTIGSRGEFLSGPYVEKSGGVSNVSKWFNVSFK